jgi:hypothetical protein
MPSRETTASTDTEVRVLLEGPRFAAYVYHHRYEIRWTRDTLEAAVGAAVLYLHRLDGDTRAVLKIDPEAESADIT